MKIAIIGPGAIGGLVAGYLRLKDQGTFLVGRPDSVKVIEESGLQISGVRGNFNVKLAVAEKLDFKPDLAILTTKTQDIETATKDNLSFLQDALILTTQNGIRADEIVARFVPEGNIISSIVMFGSTLVRPGVIVHNFEGSWILGRIFGKIDTRVVEISRFLNKIFPTIASEEIKGMKYLKIFVNANNCIPAILGLTMQEAFSDINISAISIAIWKEGLDIIDKLGIKLVSLPDFPLERLTKLTVLSTSEATKIFSGIMTTLSKEPLYGSILQSIKRGKASEIDYINGEFVSLAKNNNLKAPLNEKLVEMVHQVEGTHKFFSKEELIDNTKGFLR